MVRRNGFLLIIASVCLMGSVGIGCSSPQGDDDTTAVTPDDGTAEGSDDPLETDSPEEVDEPEPAATGPGRLRISIKASGQPASGRVRILTAEVEPQVVEEGPASQTFDLPAGQYDLQVTMEDTMDQPVKRLRDVPVRAGDTTERDVNFPVGIIKLQPRRGRSIVRSKVRWRYNGGGDWFEGNSQTGEDLTLSCGRYDAEINHGRTAIVIEDIQVYEGRRNISPSIMVGGHR